MTRSPLNCSGLFSRILQYFMLASMVTVTLQPWPASFANPVFPEKKSLRASQTSTEPVEDEPDLSAKWNQDIDSTSPATPTVQVSARTEQPAPKPSFYMKRPTLVPKEPPEKPTASPLLLSFPSPADNAPLLQKRLHTETAKLGIHPHSGQTMLPSQSLEAQSTIKNKKQKSEKWVESPKQPVAAPAQKLDTEKQKDAENQRLDGETTARWLKAKKIKRPRLSPEPNEFKAFPDPQTTDAIQNKAPEKHAKHTQRHTKDLDAGQLKALPTEKPDKAQTEKLDNKRNATEPAAKIELWVPDAKGVSSGVLPASVKSAEMTALATVFNLSPEMAAQLAIAQQKAAVYQALLNERLQAKQPGSFEPVLAQGQQAAAAVLNVLESLDDKTFEALRNQMQGYLLLRDEVLVVSPDPVYFLAQSKNHGTPADIAFFSMMRQTLNGYWPVTMERLTDLNGCTRFGTHDLVKLYGGWQDFRKQYPQAYQKILADPNLLLQSDIEDQLLNSQAACEGPDSMIQELQTFITTYPESALTPKLQIRLQQLQNKQVGETVFFQNVQHTTLK